MREQWKIYAKKADFNKIAQQYGITPVLARIIRNRDIVGEQEIETYLHGSVEQLLSPYQMKDIEKAVFLIEKAIKKQVRILVASDYDDDGIFASMILYEAIKRLGGSVTVDMPSRVKEGYGLNERMIDEAFENGVGMIVTCDNGIAATEAIAYAKSLGIIVVVTDHHEVPFLQEDGRKKELLPQALAVVDPKREECVYPFSGICGAVVAYKLMKALSERVDSEALLDAMEEFLEFAALATVCDVMELKDENRILVKEGLKRMHQTRNPGLRALIEVNGILPQKLSAYHLGFVVGPCLNATGRLDTAKRALELLQSKEKTEAMSAARELKELNDSRKNLTLKGVEEAERYIEESGIYKDKVMVIYLPKVHESLAGIIAGRIREKYYRPVFLLTRGEEGVKGSGRSIEAYHMYDAMTEVKELFTKFGGHKLASGFSMREEDIEPLRQALNEKSGLGEEDLIPRVHIDVPMPLGYADEALAAQLELLEPFGVGNPKPLFAQKDLIFLSGYKMGENKTCARYRVKTPEGKSFSLVFFGDLLQFDSFLEEKYGSGAKDALYGGNASLSVSVAYQLGVNVYRGKREMQFVMQHYC